jgi:hypothetical protein
LLIAPFTASFIFVFMRPTDPHVHVTEPETRLPRGIAPDFISKSAIDGCDSRSVKAALPLAPLSSSGGTCDVYGRSAKVSERANIESSLRLIGRQ